jgi:hypothetical protein
MATLKAIGQRARSTTSLFLDLRRRVNALEDEMQEARALNVRVAELTDLVAELLVPLAQRDEGKIQEILAKYHESI